LIKQHFDFSFVEETVRHLYTKDTGRPGHPLKTMFRILFLEIFANLPDVQVVGALRYNDQWAALNSNRRVVYAPR
jgi:hypothetical protein